MAKTYYIRTQNSLQVIQPLMAVTGLIAVLGEANQILLTWNVVSNAQTYTVYRNGVSYATGITGSVGSPTITWGDNAAANSTVYTYTVYPANMTGQGPGASVTITSFSPPPINLPGQITNVVATATGPTTATITWTADPNSTSYEVARAGTPAQDFNGLTATTYNDTGLTPNGQSYTYTVTGYNSAGEGPNSATSTITTNYIVPGQVTGLETISVTFNSVALNWNAANYAVDYIVYRNGSVIATNVSGNQYTDSGLTNGVSYTYTVAGTNPAGQGALSSPLQVTTPADSTDPLVFLTTLNTATQGFIAGMHSNDYSANRLSGICSGPGTTNFSNCTVLDYETNGQANGTPTGLAPAAFVFVMNSSYTGNSVTSATTNDTAQIANINAWKARGGIAIASCWMDNPAAGAGSGAQAANNASDVLTNGSSVQNTFYQFVDAFASNVKQIPGKVFVRIFLEMNYSGSVSAGGFWWNVHYFTPSQQAQMWQLFWNRFFVHNGVTNAYTIWCQNWNGAGTYGQAWPGAQYVDVLGCDIYSTSVSGIGDFYSQLLGLSGASNKPILLCEVGNFSSNNSAVALHTYDVSIWSSSTIVNNYPKVKGCMVFCQNWTPENQLHAQNYLGRTGVLNINGISAYNLT